jgi:hypothetical protein
LLLMAMRVKTLRKLTTCRLGSLLRLAVCRTVAARPGLSRPSPVPARPRFQGRSRACALDAAWLHEGCDGPLLHDPSSNPGLLSHPGGAGSHSIEQVGSAGQTTRSLDGTNFGRHERI